MVRKKGRYTTKLLDENLSHTCRGSAASIDADLTTVNDPSNMLTVNRHVLGTSQQKNQDLEMKMALQNLESLELMSDIQSRRRILDIPNSKRLM
jgi:hypothetical protein